MPACRGEVSYKGEVLVAQDIEHLRRALAAAGDADREAFIPAASPGCICNGAENFHYPTYEAYLQAVTPAMSVEYRAIVDGGLRRLLRGGQSPSRARVGDTRVAAHP